jgi:hypothetical protein
MDFIPVGLTEHYVMLVSQNRQGWIATVCP